MLKVFAFSKCLPALSPGEFLRPLASEVAKTVSKFSFMVCSNSALVDGLVTVAGSRTAFTFVSAKNSDGLQIDIWSLKSGHEISRLQLVHLMRVCLPTQL